jgi:hypothetical protein
MVRTPSHLVLNSCHTLLGRGREWRARGLRCRQWYEFVILADLVFESKITSFFEASDFELKILPRLSRSRSTMQDASHKAKN